MDRETYIQFDRIENKINEVLARQELILTKVAPNEWEKIKKDAEQK